MSILLEHFHHDSSVTFRDPNKPSKKPTNQEKRPKTQSPLSTEGTIITQRVFDPWFPEAVSIVFGNMAFNFVLAIILLHLRHSQNDHAICCQLIWNVPSLNPLYFHFRLFYVVFVIIYFVLLSYLPYIPCPHGCLCNVKLVLMWSRSTSPTPAFPADLSAPVPSLSHSFTLSFPRSLTHSLTHKLPSSQLR